MKERGISRSWRRRRRDTTRGWR
uniref:Uncharacterized protein n=1 Tax=Arundo donax TaxID=35708 RepID=A0A0A9C9H8_ARUDO